MRAMLAGRMDWGSWLYGLGAGFIGGGATAVSAAFSNMIVAPKTFNLEHPWLLVQSMLGVFLVSAVLNGMAYLKQKPLPEMESQARTAEAGR